MQPKGRLWPPLMQCPVQTHLCDAGQLAQVELVVEFDGRRQEVVHDVAVQLNRSIHQLARKLDDFRVKALLLQVPINHGKVDGPARNTSLARIAVPSVMLCHLWRPDYRQARDVYAKAAMTKSMSNLSVRGCGANLTMSVVGICTANVTKWRCMRGVMVKDPAVGFMQAQY